MNSIIDQAKDNETFGIDPNKPKQTKREYPHSISGAFDAILQSHRNYIKSKKNGGARL